MFKKKKVKNTTLNINKKPKIKKKKFLGLLTGFIALIIVFFIGKFIISIIPYIEIGFDVMGGLEDKQVKPVEVVDGKIRILLTGKGGGEHEGPDLTDTIILLGVDKKLKTVSMFSVPRDLYVEYPHGGKGKINEVYYRGLSYYGGDEGKAMQDLIDKVKQITGEEINYYANIDFAGFTKIIDSLGGIDVNVPVDLKDTQYPDGNYGYETFEIKAGPHTLDGETALKYARSRHSTNDFDRSLRQQLIISGIKNKIENLGYLTNSSKIKGLYLTLKENLKTNMGIGQIVDLALFAKDIEKENIKSFNLNDSCFFNSHNCSVGGFMYYPPREDFGGLSVTLPYGADVTDLENYSEIQKYTNLIFNYPEIFINSPKINIFNATKSGGLATYYANALLKYGFNVPSENSVGNARDKAYPKTVIYYNNLDEDDKTLEALSLFIFGEQIKTEAPLYSKNPDTKIEIVIGDDYESLGL